jgi:phosphatidylserine/phosphatidylglycerophosphate/cardiolipin synthase-like enzyme
VLFPGDVTLAAEAKLIEEIASRPDGWVYVTNWYAGLVFEGILMPQPSLMPFTNALWQCARKGGTIRALFWDGSLRELQAKIKEITAPLRQAGSVALTLVSPLASLAGAGSAVESAVEALIQHSITNRTNNRVNTATMTLINQMPHAAARLDDATLPVGSHHQKMLVVGNNERTVAVVGSVDLNKNRVMQLGGGTPYFDMSVQLDGQAAVDVAEIFERRWRAADDREHRAIPLPPRRPPTVAPPAPGTSSATVQVGVNYGCGHPHREIRRPVRSGGRLIANLLNNCRSFFYAEDQYGTGNDDLKRGIEQAFRNGARYGVVVLATSAGVDDIPEIEYWRHRFWSAFRQTGNNLFVFERVGDDSNPAFNDPVGPHAYVHSKLLIVDDRAASISSVNMNRRSWYYDSELAAVVTDAPDLIRKLRIDVWNTHLRDPFRLPAPDIRDPMAAADVWRAAYAHQRGLLKPIYFTRTPLRASQKTPIWATVGASLAGFDLSLIDLVMDGAHKELYDPEGPPRC